jgi:hypothetical protein
MIALRTISALYLALRTVSVPRGGRRKARRPGRAREVGRTPWSAAGPLASLSAFRRKLPNPAAFMASGGPQGDAGWLPNLRPIGDARLARPEVLGLLALGSPIKRTGDKIAGVTGSPSTSSQNGTPISYRSRSETAPCPFPHIPVSDKTPAILPADSPAVNP